MKKYKITVSNNGVGYKAILWKKFLFFYLPDTISQCANGYPYNNTVQRWQSDFNIPDENVKFKF